MNCRKLSSKTSALLLILIPFLFSIESSAQTMANDSSSFHNVWNFGAKGDGKALDTDAINKAIDAAWAKGGGTVYFPSGTYLSFSIHLKSNITIFLDIAFPL